MKKRQGIIVEYSGKEIMCKLDSIGDKINRIHELTAKTNGKVKLHTKLIIGTYSVLFTLLLLFMEHLISSVK